MSVFCSVCQYSVEVEYTLNVDIGAPCLKLNFVVWVEVLVIAFGCDTDSENGVFGFGFYFFTGQMSWNWFNICL